jgi:hypothetical protein
LQKACVSAILILMASALKQCRVQLAKATGGKSKMARKAVGVALAAKLAHPECKARLSLCMRGKGRGKGGPCLKMFHACRKAKAK